MSFMAAYQPRADVSASRLNDVRFAMKLMEKINIDLRSMRLMFHIMLYISGTYFVLHNLEPGR